MKMSSTAIVSMVVAFSCTVALHAQAPANRQGKTSSTKMTVTGCVERADQIIPGGTPSNTVDSLTFVLIDPTGTAADAGRGAVGTGGTTPSAKTPRIYLLD